MRKIRNLLPLQLFLINLDSHVRFQNKWLSSPRRRNQNHGPNMMKQQKGYGMSAKKWWVSLFSAYEIKNSSEKIVVDSHMKPFTSTETVTYSNHDNQIFYE